MLGVCFVLEIMKSFLRSLYSMVNKFIPFKKLQENYDANNGTKKALDALDKSAELRGYYPEDEVNKPSTQEKGNDNNSETICNNATNECKKHKEIVKQRTAALGRATNLFKPAEPESAESEVPAASESAVPAAGGARKSRKHKRTRKHMRKHTRKHKVMKSKMTKSKSKKVMQKGGDHGAHGKEMEEFYKKREDATRKSLERLRKRKVATREIELGNLRERKLVTQRKLVTRRKKTKGH